MKSLVTVRWMVVGVLVASLTACSTHRSVCEQWQSEGPLMATIPSCERCVEMYGTSNKQLVMGCALGLDASRLLGK